MHLVVAMSLGIRSTQATFRVHACTLRVVIMHTMQNNYRKRESSCTPFAFCPANGGTVGLNQTIEERPKNPGRANFHRFLPSMLGHRQLQSDLVLHRRYYPKELCRRSNSIKEEDYSADYYL